MENEVCLNCRFYHESHAGTHGYCKASPPVFTNLDEQGRPRFFNPVVGPNNWCGLWEGEDE